MKREHLEDFVICYHADDITKREQTWSEENPNGRWRKFSIEEIKDSFSSVEKLPALSGRPIKDAQKERRQQSSDGMRLLPPVKSCRLTSEIAAVLVGFVEEEFVLDVLLGGYQRRLRETFIIARDFDLLAVLAHFFKIVVVEIGRAHV